jgi:hypothetical protein
MLMFRKRKLRELDQRGRRTEPVRTGKIRCGGKNEFRLWRTRLRVNHETDGENDDFHRKLGGNSFEANFLDFKCLGSNVTRGTFRLIDANLRLDRCTDEQQEQQG